MAKGLTLEDLFPGRFLRSVEFKGKSFTLTMTGVELEDLPTDKGAEQTRGIISFKETPKKWVLNKTNGESLKAMFGRQCDDWIGKQIMLYPEKVKLGKDIVDGIRVKGSPDIAQPISFELRLPRKKPVQVKLIPTPRPGARPAPSESAPPLPDEPPADLIT